MVGVIAIGEADRLAFAVLPVAAALGDGGQPAVLHVEGAQCVGVPDLDVGRQITHRRPPRVEQM